MILKALMQIAKEKIVKSTVDRKLEQYIEKVPTSIYLKIYKENLRLRN